MKFFQSTLMRRPAFSCSQAQMLSSIDRALFNNIYSERRFATVSKCLAQTNSRYEIGNRMHDCRHDIIREIVSAVQLQTNEFDFCFMPHDSATPLLFRFVGDDMSTNREEKVWCGLSIRSRRARQPNGLYQFSTIHTSSLESSLICKVVDEGVLYYFSSGEPPVKALHFTATGKYRKYCTRMDNLTPKLLESWNIKRRATRENWLSINHHDMIAVLIRQVYRPLGMSVSFPNFTDPIYDTLLSSEFGSFRVRHQTAYYYGESFRCQWGNLTPVFQRSYDEFFDFCIVPIQENSVMQGFFVFPKKVFLEHRTEHWQKVLYPPFHKTIRNTAFMKAERKWQEQFYVDVSHGVDFDKFKQILKVYAPK